MGNCIFPFFTHMLLSVVCSIQDRVRKAMKCIREVVISEADENIIAISSIQQKKPRREDAPFDFSIICGYILTPDVSQSEQRAKSGPRQERSTDSRFAMLVERGTSTCVLCEGYEVRCGRQSRLFNRHGRLWSGVGRFGSGLP